MVTLKLWFLRQFKNNKNCALRTSKNYRVFKFNSKQFIPNIPLTRHIAMTRPHAIPPSHHNTPVKSRKKSFPGTDRCSHAHHWRASPMHVMHPTCPAFASGAPTLRTIIPRLFLCRTCLQFYQFQTTISHFEFFTLERRGALFPHFYS